MTLRILDKNSTRKASLQEVGVVIPSYNTAEHILSVIAAVGPEVSAIYVVDDRCPQSSGRLVQTYCTDPRVKVIHNPHNLGVGGATMVGYRQALQDGIEIVVKLDGDGQMDAALIPSLIGPIQRGEADYTKGNRFFELENLESMPAMRIFGNTALSFVSKVASGYWNVMDPTNGFTAIHSAALSLLPLQKIDRRYFFESDMLFRLNTVRAVVREMPMKSKYGTEQSGLRIMKVLREFPMKYLSRFFKRLFYNYILRDFNACSLQLIAGLILLTFGAVFGGFNWYRNAMHNTSTATGTIMLAVLPVIVGVQLLLEAVSQDIMNVPAIPLQTMFDWRERWYQKQIAAEKSRAIAG